MSTPATSPGSPGVVVQSPERTGRIDHHSGSAGYGERAVPYHCPYCADADLRPRGAAPGAWHCRGCMRAFTVSFLGVETDLVDQTPSHASDPAAPTGEAR